MLPQRPSAYEQDYLRYCIPFDIRVAGYFSRYSPLPAPVPEEAGAGAKAKAKAKKPGEAPLSFTVAAMRGLMEYVTTHVSGFLHESDLVVEGSGDGDELGAAMFKGAQNKLDQQYSIYRTRLGAKLAAHKGDEGLAALLAMDPWVWLEEGTKDLPVMARIARGILCTTASSVGPESFFSLAGRIMSPLRASLLPARHSKLAMMGAWRKADVREAKAAAQAASGSSSKQPKGGLPDLPKAWDQVVQPTAVLEAARLGLNEEATDIALAPAAVAAAQGLVPAFVAMAMKGITEVVAEDEVAKELTELDAVAGYDAMLGACAAQLAEEAF